jgi:tetratricopeptide (TPR) repeat protein
MMSSIQHNQRVLYMPLIFLCAVLLLWTTPADAQSAFPGDDAFARMDYQAAIATYDSLARVRPDDPQVQWRLARAQVFIGDVSRGEEKKQAYLTAERYAREAMRLDSSLAESNTWLAAALGNTAMYEGSKKKIALANEIKRLLLQSINLNPRDDIAWSILGTFYLALGNVSWLERTLANLLLGSLPEGGYEDAEAALLKALQIAPNVIRHRFELGMVYTKLDREEDARKEFEFCVTHPIQMASDRRRVEHAQEWLEEHGFGKQ